jgi:hypothetical protein
LQEYNISLGNRWFLSKNQCSKVDPLLNMGEIEVGNFGPRGITAMKRSQLLLGTALLGTALAGTVLFAAAPADAQFYARLDSGFAWGQDAGFGDNQAQIDATTTLFIEDETESPGKLDNIGNSWLVDGGIGFRFNPWLMNSRLACA